MREHDWTERERGNWTLSSPSGRLYEVARRGPGDYRMLINGCQVDSADTAGAAKVQLGYLHEYEQHASELELARLRLRQLRERLAARFPAAARDGQLSSILTGLGEALGEGPETGSNCRAAEPGKGTFGRLLTSDAAIAVDGSACIVLVVTEPAGKLLRVVTVTNVDTWKSALDDARDVQQVALTVAADTAAPITEQPAR